MERTTEIPIQFLLVKYHLQKQFPHLSAEAEGVDLKKVETYILNQGLPIKPYILFKNDELPIVNEIVGRTNLTRSVFNKDARGLYVPEIDLAMVMREDDYEGINGAIYTEGLLAHELGHASSLYATFIKNNPESFRNPRIGFGLPQNNMSWGSFFEEGFADMARGNYIAEKSTPNQKKSLQFAINFPELDWDDTVSVIVPQGYAIPLPAKYLYLKPEGAPTTKSSSYAAFGVELLCNRDPYLLDALKEGRGSVVGLREVARRINKLSPGLYGQIQRCDYTEEDFADKLRMVIKSLYGDRWSVIQSKGRLTEVWHKVIAETKPF